MDQRIIGRIERAAGVPDLVGILADRLSATERPVFRSAYGLVPRQRGIGEHAHLPHGMMSTAHRSRAVDGRAGWRWRKPSRPGRMTP